MSKQIKVIFIIIAFLFINCPVSKASSGLKMNTLEYDIILQEDGSMQVKEIWDINIEDTNTLFKTFQVDKEKYDGIVDVSVSEQKKDGTVNNFTKVDKETYHVDKDCFYALITQKGEFEIAWGAHAQDTTKQYKIEYTVKGAVKNYQDVAELYWQLIGKDSQIPIDLVKGQIQLPKPVTEEQQFKVWAHGPLNGIINKTSNQQVNFEVSHFPTNTFLEVRIVTPTEIFSTNLNKVSQKRQEQVLEEETKWAKEANDQREQLIYQQQRRETTKKWFFIISESIGMIIMVLLIWLIIRKSKQLKKYPKLKATQKPKYYPEIPDEKSTPAQAAFLFYYPSSINALEQVIPKVICATMLDLCKKGYLTFLPSTNKKEQIRIQIKQKEDNLLEQDEKIMLDLLKQIQKEESFSMKEMQKYMTKNSAKVLKIFKQIEDTAKKQQEEKKNCDGKREKEATSFMAKGVGYLFLTLLGIICMKATILPAIILTIMNFILSSRIKQLTQKGMDEKALWIGLKRYMEDFSLLKEKEVPALIVWEEYLVYATVFGIADKVIKQLKVTYPEMNTQMVGDYSYLSILYHTNLTTNLIRSLDKSISSTYNTINYSSGSGAGGGFSAGGGFGAGGGRNGRKIIFFPFLNRKTIK